METVTLQSASLTNFEVMRFLQEQRDEMKLQKGTKKEKKKRVNKSLLTVTLETLSWLENQPASVQAERRCCCIFVEGPKDLACQS